MVKSKLSANVNYHEYSHLEEEDFNYNTPLYNVKIMGITVIVGVGQLNYTFSKKSNIVYLPLYLFNAEYKFVKQIGVYEMHTDHVKMDNSGDVDINKLNPLLYGFVTTELLRKSLIKSDNDKKKNITPTVESKALVMQNKLQNVKTVNDIKKSLGKNPIESTTNNDLNKNLHDDENDVENEGIDIDHLFGVDNKQKNALSGASILPLQTKDQSEVERKQYTYNTNDIWIQKYMRNKYFNITDNEGGSDSLYAVIRDALLTQGRSISIQELRKQLADEVTDDVFNKYRERYALYHNILKTQNNESKEHIAQYNVYKKRI